MNHKLTKEEQEDLFDRINKILNRTEMTGADFAAIITTLIAVRYSKAEDYISVIRSIKLIGVQSLLDYEEEYGKAP